MHRTELRKKLLANGYTPLPNSRKACFTEGWSKMSVTPELIESWHRHGRTPDTGVRLDEMAAADLDVTDPDLQAACQLAMLETFGESPCKRVGDPRKSMFIFRYEGEPVTKIRTGKYGDNEVEVLMKGCQFGAFGQHSDDYEYEWPESSLLDVPHDELPLVTLDQIRAFVARCEALFIEAGLEKKSDGGETGQGYTIVRDLDWGTAFEVKDHGSMTVEDMQAHLESGATSLRCSMEPFREDADNLSSGQASLDRDGFVVISDYGAGVSHMMPLSVKDEDLEALGQKLAAIKATPAEDLEPDSLEEALARTAKGFTLLATEEKVAHMSSTGRIILWKKQGFGMRFPQKIRMPGIKQKMKMGHVLMDMMDVADGTIFRPDETSALVAHEGMTMLNTYSPPAHVASAPPSGAMDFFNALMQRTFDNKADRDWVTTWLAYKLQNPHSRGPAVMSLSAVNDQGMAQYGTGRGSFQKMLGLLFGRQYVSEIPFETLAGKNYQSQYNDWLSGSLVVCVGEAKDTSAEHVTKRNARVAAYEVIKQVTEPGDTTMQINRKGVGNVQESIFVTLFLASNHGMPFELPYDDRRIYVTRSSRLIEDRQAARAVWDDIHKGMADPAKVAAVYYYLMGTDVSAYSPYDPVPMNAVKEELADRSVSEVSGLAREFIATSSGDMVVVRDLEKVLTRFMLGEGISEPDRLVGIVKQELLSLGRRLVPGNSGKRWKVRGHQERPWVIRNYDKWCSQASEGLEAKVVAREVCAAMSWEKSPVRPLNR